MKRFSRSGRHAAWALACLGALACGQQGRAAEPQVTFRDLAVRFFEDGNGEDLAKAVGWTKPVKKVIALEYKVLLFQDGRETPVDPKTHPFKLGDRIRVEILPFSDSYIYIFHVGASGKSLFLLPPEDREPPYVKGKSTIRLPVDGYFEFTAPPGNEKLMVVAAEKPVPDRQMLARVLTKNPTDYTPEEQSLSKQLQATVEANLISVQEKEQAIRDKVVKFRGGLEDALALAQDVRTRGVERGTIEEPNPNPSKGTTAMYISISGDKELETRTNLLVTIPLTSQH
jgi:hypothetical protein